MEYGLIGEKLGHSFSKAIHERIAPYTYDLCPLSKEAFARFMEQRNFQAINVTIPYKQDVLPYLDEIDEHAQAIGAVNTIVNRNGHLIGHNTDFSGSYWEMAVHPKLSRRLCSMSRQEVWSLWILLPVNKRSHMKHVMPSIPMPTSSSTHPLLVCTPTSPARPSTYHVSLPARVSWMSFTIRF